MRPPYSSEPDAVTGDALRRPDGRRPRAVTWWCWPTTTPTTGAAPASTRSSPPPPRGRGRGGRHDARRRRRPGPDGRRARRALLAPAGRAATGSSRSPQALRVSRRAVPRRRACAGAARRCAGRSSPARWLAERDDGAARRWRSGWRVLRLAVQWLTARVHLRRVRPPPSPATALSRSGLRRSCRPTTRRPTSPRP